MSGQYLSSNFAEKLVKQKGSGYHVIIGVLVLIVGLAIGMATSNNLVTHMERLS